MSSSKASYNYRFPEGGLNDGQRILISGVVQDKASSFAIQYMNGNTAGTAVTARVEVRLKTSGDSDVGESVACSSRRNGRWSEEMVSASPFSFQQKKTFSLEIRRIHSRFFEVWIGGHLIGELENEFDDCSDSLHIDGDVIVSKIQRL
ncbi:uncharacterized protein LOC112566032 [Pomacea canaliculata]|uniref:uncharacterized protein LOC112566032 n=1 Tax=Pomacea canaliculata TaxID=400727 RepID=UPI000D738713|nr:uncharacterized protein LOC112566032 [Pomacea canaliculata]